MIVKNTIVCHSCSLFGPVPQMTGADNSRAQQQRDESKTALYTPILSIQMKFIY